MHTNTYQPSHSNIDMRVMICSTCGESENNSIVISALYVGTRVCVDIFVRLRVCARARACVRECVSARVRVCLCSCVCVCACVLCVSVRVCTYVHF